MRKRQRSDSLSDSPPPSKRRPQAAPASNSISAEIWKLFGKDRNAYVARDVYSDDEDMEAGADEVEREEKYRFVYMHISCDLAAHMRLFVLSLPV